MPCMTCVFVQGVLQELGVNALVTCYRPEHTANGRGVFWHGRHVHRHFFPIGGWRAPGSGVCCDGAGAYNFFKDVTQAATWACKKPRGVFGVLCRARVLWPPASVACFSLGNWDMAQETLDFVRTHLQTTNVGVRCLGCHHRAPSTLVALAIGLLGRLSQMGVAWCVLLDHSVS